MKYIIQFCLIWMVGFTHAQSVDILIQEALENSPNIERLDYQYQVAKERINEVNTLPNTEFSFGFMAIKPEMDMPMTRFSVSAMQMFPWFGTIDVKENFASSLAETNQIDIEIAQRKLVLSMTQIYFKLYEIQAQKTILQENLTLLDTFETLALSSVKVGKASSVDVLRLQIRQNEMEEEIKLLEQKSVGLVAAINSLMNRAYDTPIHIESNLAIPNYESDYSYDALASNPEILKFDKVEASVNQSELVNQKESSPMLGVGIEYINQTDSPMITSSFKDMVMPMVSLSIPLFNHKYKSVTAQNQLKIQEIKAQRNQRLNELTAQLSQSLSILNQAKIKYETQKDNLEIAKNAEKILLKNYETGIIDYDEVLNIQALQLKFQKDQISAIKQYHEQMALIQYLINDDIK